MQHCYDGKGDPDKLLEAINSLYGYCDAAGLETHMSQSDIEAYQKLVAETGGGAGGGAGAGAGAR